MFIVEKSQRFSYCVAVIPLTYIKVDKYVTALHRKLIVGVFVAKRSFSYCVAFIPLHIYAVKITIHFRVITTWREESRHVMTILTSVFQNKHMSIFFKLTQTEDPLDKVLNGV